MPDIRQVLDAYERTIIANEMAGVTSNMYLSNLARKQSVHCRSRAHHRPSMSKQFSKRCSLLEDLPEGVPTDITIDTTNSRLDDDEDSLNEGIEGFARHGSVVDDLNASLHSMASTASRRSLSAPSQRRAPSRQNSNTSLLMMARTASSRSLMVDDVAESDENGFKIITREEESVFSGRSSISGRKFLPNSLQTASQAPPVRLPASRSVRSNSFSTNESVNSQAPPRLPRRSLQSAESGGASPSGSPRSPHEEMLLRCSSSSRDKSASDSAAAPRMPSRRSDDAEPQRSRRKQLLPAEAPQQRSSVGSLSGPPKIIQHNTGSSFLGDEGSFSDDVSEVSFDSYH